MLRLPNGTIILHNLPNGPELLQNLPNGMTLLAVLHPLHFAVNLFAVQRRTGTLLLHPISEIPTKCRWAFRSGRGPSKVF